MNTTACNLTRVAAGLLAAAVLLPATADEVATPPKAAPTKGIVTPSKPQPGYLLRGAPFKLRSASNTRPPAYALPPLPITPDPQPMALAAGNPAQPLNPAQAGPPPAMIPSGGVPGGQPRFVVEAVTPLIPAPAIMSAPGMLPGVPGAQAIPGLPQATQSTFLNPQILRYFNADANGTYQSRIMLNGSSLFTLPALNPLVQPGGSRSTYQIK